MDQDEDDIPWTYASTQETASDAHGQAMFSSAVGGKNGVSRNANAVMVKWPVYWEPSKGKMNQQTHYSAKALLSGFDQIYDDIVANGMQGKAVINMSFCESIPPMDVESHLNEPIQTFRPAQFAGLLEYGTDLRMRCQS